MTQLSDPAVADLSVGMMELEKQISASSDPLDSYKEDTGSSKFRFEKDPNEDDIADSVDAIEVYLPESADDGLGSLHEFRNDGWTLLTEDRFGTLYSRGANVE